jgi:hypothetical protein
VPSSSRTITAITSRPLLSSPVNLGAVNNFIYDSPNQDADFEFDISGVPTSQLWEFTFDGFQFPQAFNTFGIRTPSFRDPYISTYDPGDLLIINVKPSPGPYVTGQNITCTATPAGVVGAVPVNSSDTVPYSSTTPSVFSFDIATILSNEWNFELRNQTSGRTMRLENVRTPSVRNPVIRDDLPIITFDTGGGDFVVGDTLTATAAPSSGSFVAISSLLTRPYPGGGLPVTFAFAAPSGAQPFAPDSDWNLTVTNTTRGRTITFFGARAICFLAGTLIRTPSGEVPVESLKVGDSIVSLGTLKNRSAYVPYPTACDKPIKRIVDFKIPGRTSDISRPIKIKAGALGPNVPHQDLFVSPWHGMIVDGVMRNTITLINGDTIDYDHTIKSVHYYHIELEDHSVILANGAEAETFYDDAKDLPPASQTKSEGLLDA